jgi:hypothetical protein
MITYKIGFFLDYSSARKTKEDENSFFKKLLCDGLTLFFKSRKLCTGKSSRYEDITGV